ncbi:hypothetical protein GWK08_14735 [Leptobacterium flavescens]|uniref:Toxin-antitoxin system YwqK family antitoxin n=1 Tax=Leptobacterium flavescens TaxID=472055 RepID=A0A6P0UQF5_9FLAO|nr:hypothetical protein [Leptobacterium flavescens]NER14710.1 hypothetical protein [Leptobacterium flavescens]
MFKNLMAFALVLLTVTIAFGQENIPVLNRDQLNIDFSYDEKKQPSLFTLKNGELLNGKFRVNLGTGKYSSYTICNYKDGYKNGIMEHYSSGTLMMRAEYCMGLVCGVFDHYFRNGSPSQSKSFNKEQKLHGLVTNYRETDGKMLEKVNYKNGIKHGIQKTFYTDDKSTLSMETNYVEGKKTGKETGYHKNGKISFIRHYKDDVYDGSYITYFKTGGVEIEMTYKNGVLMGKEKMYRKAGDQTRLVLEKDHLDKNSEIWIYHNGSVPNKRYFIKKQEVTKEEFDKSIVRR